MVNLLPSRGSAYIRGEEMSCRFKEKHEWKGEEFFFCKWHAEPVDDVDCRVCMVDENVREENGAY